MKPTKFLIGLSAVIIYVLFMIVAYIITVFITLEYDYNLWHWGFRLTNSIAMILSSIKVINGYYKLCEKYK